MKYYAVYNPLSGIGKAKEEASKLSELYGEEVIACDITEIKSYKDFFSRVCEDDIVILIGGDGTINRFVNETEDVSIPCDIFYHALGTGNDFLRDINKTAEDAPFSIKGYIQNLPCVTIKGKNYRFLNNVGFGIDGYCCEVGDNQKESSTKPVNYTAIAIKGLLFHYRPTNATVTVDGKEFRYKKVWLAPTMKGRFYGGGMMAAPEQDRNASDGSLSVMLFYGAGRLRTLMAFPSIFKGEHVKRTKMVAIHKGKDIYVKFDSPAPVQIDGETILGVTEYHATASSLVTASRK